MYFLLQSRLIKEYKIAYIRNCDEHHYDFFSDSLQLFLVSNGFA